MSEEITAMKTTAKRYDMLTHNTYQDLLFEFGCKFLELNVSDAKVRNVVMQENRFWKWWNLQYRLHDGKLNCNDANLYVRRKEEWLQSKLMLNKFYNYLIEQ